MDILRSSCARGAREAEGLVVIIDVFRAFSCAPLFFHFGARRVILAADPEAARALKRDNPDYLLVGEVNEVPLADADLGNSPSQIARKGRPFLQGRTVVHRTTAGVTGVAAAMDRAETVLLGSFVMARAIADHIRGRNPRQVTLVAMGDRAQEKAPEDEACADYLEHLLCGTPYRAVETLRDVVFQPTAQKFVLGTREYLPREDPIFCLQRDLFDFVLAARRSGDLLEAYRIEPLKGGSKAA